MLNRFRYEKGLPVELIGNLVPKRGVTLLHGRSGCGKTYSMLKMLISEKYKPIFIDFDSNDEYSSMDLVHIDGWKLASAIISDPDILKEIVSDLRDEIVVVDTYAMADIALKGGVLSFVDSLKDVRATVIVIAHTTYFSGKPAEPSVDVVFANHVDSKLHLHYDVKKTKTDCWLEIEKLRGTDSRIITDWMRGAEDLV